MNVALPHAFTDVLDETFAELERQLSQPFGQRYPIERTGERDQLPRALRWLVWHRDRGRCTFCGRGDLPMQLDHVIPWSAGGPDTATNLRTMCAPCNETRSNLNLPEIPIDLLAVTALCDPCIDRHDDGARPHSPAYAFCLACNNSSPNRLTHPDAEQHLAFCGSCRRRSWVSDPARLM